MLTSKITRDDLVRMLRDSVIEAGPLTPCPDPWKARRDLRFFAEGHQATDEQRSSVQLSTEEQAQAYAVLFLRFCTFSLSSHYAAVARNENTSFERARAIAFARACSVAQMLRIDLAAEADVEMVLEWVRVGVAEPGRESSRQEYSSEAMLKLLGMSMLIGGGLPGVIVDSAGRTVPNEVQAALVAVARHVLREDREIVSAEDLLRRLIARSR